MATLRLFSSLSRCLRRRVTFHLLIIFITITLSYSFEPSFVNPRQVSYYHFQSSISKLHTKRSSRDDNDGTLEAVEALQSLADFHEGRWKGKARSFTITDDVDAGIVQRKESPEYMCFVKLGMKNAQNRDFTLTESFQWDDKTKFSSRTLSLQNSRVDVDSVDASYSLDSIQPQSLPTEIIGTDIMPQFMIEHCLAVSDDERARLFVLYGSSTVNSNGGGVDGGSKDVNGSKLFRLVVLQETRVYDVDEIESPSSSLQQEQQQGGSTNSLTAADLLEMESDVDRLVDKIAGQIPKQENGKVSEPPYKPPLADRLKRLEKATSAKSDSSPGTPPLTRHDLSLLELSSGVWLGDVIIRDQQVRMGSSGTSRGFASRSTSSSSSTSPCFAEWELGVQKVEWRWMWNFGDEIRQVNNVGKAMGVGLVTNAIASSLSGFVALNEGLSRRIPKANRMVYIDWSGDNVGFLLENVSIQVPRYLNFQDTLVARPPVRASEMQRPFYTEFGVYQNGAVSLSSSADENTALPQVVCSKIARVYDPQGQLRQGCTSFYTLKRFGVDGDEDEL